MHAATPYAFLHAATPFAILPAAFDAMHEVAAWHRGRPPQSAPPVALAHRPLVPLANAQQARQRGNIAVLPVNGLIQRRETWLSVFLATTSLGTLAQDLTVAVADARIAAIVLEIDSAGGELTGVHEAAWMIRQAAAQKPLLAYVEGIAGSAAYLLASAASELVLAPSAIVGGLGIIMEAVDRTGADRQAGIQRHAIVSSQTPGKRPDPSTDAGRASMQATVDTLADVFLGDVAANRSMTVERLLSATGGGGLLVGSAAVAAGLADRVAGFEGTMDRLAAGQTPALRPARAVGSMAPAPAQSPPPTPRAASPQPRMEPVMPSPSPAATRSPEILDIRARAQFAIDPAIRTEFGSADIYSAFTLGEARKRLHGSRAAPAVPDLAAVQAAARAEFAASADLRAEFRTVETYLAFRTAEAHGRARIAGRRSA